MSIENVELKLSSVLLATPGFVLLKSLERGKISEPAFPLPCPNEKLFPSRNYQGKEYKLSAQQFSYMQTFFCLRLLLQTTFCVCLRFPANTLIFLLEYNLFPCLQPLQKLYFKNFQTAFPPPPPIGKIVMVRKTHDLFSTNVSHLIDIGLEAQVQTRSDRRDGFFKKG